MDKNKKLFPQRLWDLIHDTKYNFCLRWSPDGQRIYLNRTEFEANYLKTPNNQFHTQKAISFVRQMNMYGFRKVDDCYYENDNFKRNCPHLLKNMIRRHSNRGFFSLPPPNNDQQLSNNLNNNSHHHNPNNQTTNTIINASVIDKNRRHSFIDQQHLLMTHGITTHHPELNYQEHKVPSSASLLERQVTGAVRGLDKASSSIDSLPLGAAMAAAAALDPSTNMKVTNPALASSLYLRLAALNFGQQSTNSLANSTIKKNPQFIDTQLNKTAEQNMTLAPQMIGSAVGPTNSPSRSPLMANYGVNSLNSSQNSSQTMSANTTMSNSSNSSISNGSVGNNRAERCSPMINQQQSSSNFNTGDIPMNLNQSFATQQAIQQSLVRSLLQNQASGVHQNFFLGSQGCDPNLLLETLVNMNNNNACNSSNTSSIFPNFDINSSSQLNANQQLQQHSPSNLNNQRISYDDINNHQLLTRLIGLANNNFGNIFNNTRQTNMTIRDNLLDASHFVQENEAEQPIDVDDNDARQEEDEIDIEMNDNIYQSESIHDNIDRSVSQTSPLNHNVNTLSPGSNVSQHDSNDVVLDLAKPSNKKLGA